MKLILDGRALRSATLLHESLQTLFGFPTWYGHNWDALLDCLSSLGGGVDSLCRVFEGQLPRPVVVQITAFSLENADPAVLGEFLHAVATANARLAAHASPCRVLLEFESPADTAMFA